MMTVLALMFAAMLTHFSFGSDTMSKLAVARKIR